MLREGEVNMMPRIATFLEASFGHPASVAPAASTDLAVDRVLDMAGPSVSAQPTLGMR